MTTFPDSNVSSLDWFKWIWNYQLLHNWVSFWGRNFVSPLLEIYPSQKQTTTNFLTLKETKGYTCHVIGILIKSPLQHTSCR